MSKSKKMTKKEFFEVLRNAGEVGDDFESLLNSIACFCWEKYHRSQEEGNAGLADAYKHEAKTIHDALDKRGYFDN